jgi:tetratricopeptide (TPR) repeat protein
MQELRALRSAWIADPKREDTAVRLARRYLEEVAAEGDPRYVGYAQAALAPWWSLPDPPPDIRVTRAMLLQFNHRFDEALADLDAAVQQDPNLGEAWAWQMAVRMVRADYPGAQRACTQMARLGTPLIGVACQAQIDAATGQAGRAAGHLQAALKSAAGASPEQQLWVLTRLAETEDRRGQFKEAEAAYRQALALGVTDGYLLAAYGDFLLDRGRPAEVLALLKGKTRSDLLLLRLALAAKLLGSPELAGWQSELAARFEAARLRGDSVHQKEEARFALAVLGQTPRALSLAQQNYAVQREPADARVLLEAALAARQRQAAEPALAWLTQSGIESVALQALAQQLRALP